MTAALLFGSPFPVPQFARLAPKPLLRSWFLLDDDYTNLPRVTVELRVLLTQLDPRAAHRARNADARVLYLKILRWCSARFPVQGYVIHMVLHAWDEEEAWGMLDVLPVQPQGFSFDDEIPAALAICGLLSLWDVFTEDYAAGEQLLQKHAWLRAYAPAERELASRYDDYREPPSLPRGRVWIKPWDALHDACEWVTARTGIAFLDYDQTSMDEAGCDSYPRLTLDEIRASETQWRAAAKIVRRVNEFVAYIGNRRERMQLLADVLARKPDALRQVTRPKP